MLEIINLTKTYKTKYDIITPLENINITLPSKGMVVLPGESGCGKTTFLNLIGALDLPDSGEILFNGKDITKLDSKELNEYRNYNVGFVFQDYNLLSEFNVYDNLALALDLQDVKDKKENISNVLKMIKLQGYETRKVKQLSGGQKQRIAIARALLKECNYILADEPTGNLDYETSNEIFKILKEISKERLVVVVTHDLDRVRQYGDRSIEFRNSSVFTDVIINTENNDVSSIIADDQSNEIAKNIDLIVDELHDEELSSSPNLYSESSSTDGGHRRKVKSSLSATQVLKFSTTNMCRRVFRLTVAILMTIVTLIAFGLAFATNVTDTSMGVIFEPYYKDVNLFTTIIDQDETIINGKDPFNVEAVASIEQNFNNKNMPIYTAGHATNYTVVNEETLENFGFFLHSKNSDFDYVLPQSINEISYIMPKTQADGRKLNKSTVKYLYDLPVKEVSIFTYNERDLKDKATEVFTKLINKHEDKLLDDDYTFEKALEEYVDRYLRMFDGLCVVTQEFIDNHFDEAVSAQEVGFKYVEYSKYIHGGNNYEYMLNTFEKQGSAINVNLIEKYDAEIIYSNAKSSTEPLADNEVIVSDEFAKALMSRTLKKSSDNITKQEVIQGMNNGNLIIDNMSFGNDIINNPKVVGVYFEEERYNWTDSKFEFPFPPYAQSTVFGTPPIVVSDYYYNIDRRHSVSNHPQSYIVDNSENMMDVDFINSLDNSNTQCSEFYYNEFNSVKYSMSIRDTHGMIYLFIALGASVLAILVILSYILAVTKDSKKKIGILRAHGVSGLSVGMIYLIEALMLTIIAFLLALPFTYLISNSVLINGFRSFSLVTVKTCVIGYQSILAMAGVSVGVGALGAMIPIVLYSKKSPVELIREDV